MVIMFHHHPYVIAHVALDDSSPLPEPGDIVSIFDKGEWRVEERKWTIEKLRVPCVRIRVVPHDRTAYEHLESRKDYDRLRKQNRIGDGKDCKHP